MSIEVPTAGAEDISPGVDTSSTKSAAEVLLLLLRRVTSRSCSPPSTARCSSAGSACS